jgi:hypothetical protein
MMITFYYYLIIYFLFDNKDEDEAYNNPNLHTEEQDELEIPDGKNYFLKKNEKIFCLNY